MNYSTLNEIYGKNGNIKTDLDNKERVKTHPSEIKPSRDISKEHELLYGTYKNSNISRKPEVAPAVSPDEHKKEVRLPILSHDIDDELASVSSDNNTVVIGGGEGGPIPGYADARQFSTVNEVIGQGLLDNHKTNKPVETTTDMYPGILESILEKVNELLTKVDLNEQNERRTPYEIYVHIALYFITGLFIIYMLYYIFSLGQQNIKISLIR